MVAADAAGLFYWLLADAAGWLLLLAAAAAADTCRCWLLLPIAVAAT